MSAGAGGRVVLSEPMRRFACNLKGCCCQGWVIPFQVDDLVRLHTHLPPDERERLGHGMSVVVDPPTEADGPERLRYLRLATVGDDEACRFLEGGGCRVHAQAGLAALPDICVLFPAVPTRRANHVEIYWDPICPEVLRQLDEGDAPLALHEGPLSAEPDGPAALGPRARLARDEPMPHVGGRALTEWEFERMRSSALAALAEPERPAWRALAAVMEGFRQLDPAAPSLELVPREPEPMGPFIEFVGHAMSVLGPKLLGRAILRYRRFIHQLDPEPLLADPERLVEALSDWRDNGPRWVAPAEESLRPLMLRYLGHKFAMLYLSQEGEVRQSADTIAFTYATALRVAGALGELAGRVVDRPLFQVALGASESAWRSVELTPDQVPWYAGRPEGRPPRSDATS